MSTDKLSYNRTVGLCSMEGRGFYFPADTVIGSDEKLYTVSRSLDGDTRGVRVTIYDIDEEYYGTFSGYGEDPGDLIWPTSITQSNDDTIIVTDEYLNRVSFFETTGQLIRTWDNAGMQDINLDGPAGIAVDTENNVYISDHHNHRIQVVSQEGYSIASFGELGSSEENLNSPWGITIAPNGDLYIADWHNDRIQRFSTDGTFIASYGESGREEHQLRRPASVCVDKDDYIYIADWGNERVKVMNPSGQIIQSLRGQATESKWAQAFLEINVEEADARNNSDLETELDYFTDDPHEVSSHIEKLFWAPMSVKLDSHNRIYITESNRHRVQIYDIN